MTDDPGPSSSFQNFTRWATTPPQAYGVYLAAVVVVFVLAFYAGTMKPKKTPEVAPAPVAAPKS